EIDDNGRPFWVISYYTFTIGIVGGKDVAGVIVVDAVSGEMTDYPKETIPQWIDRAYSAELVVEQANNWGSLANGFFNSIFVQKGVVVTTEGYNYIAVDGDVWLYTGITSVVSDESNIGFILINMRTKEAKTYMINGAEEYSAMESAQGQIQEKGYTATFPILLNIANRPTYFISLKDNAGLVKAYAFVSVSDYQIVGVADKISDANAEYRRMLGLEVEDEVEIGDTVEYEGEIVDIASAVKNGNTLFYMIIRRTDVAEATIYTADIRVSDALPFIKVGDKVTFNADDECRISKIKIS
ncbi:MAG: CvpA family protein, partial [Clostridia bacterium]|nr:CvpA family protein [Clostridia bacterium]